MVHTRINQVLLWVFVLRGCLAMFLRQSHLKDQWGFWMWCVVCNCVLEGYTAGPLNVIGHIQQTHDEWCLLSPPSDITALSHLFSPHIHALTSARQIYKSEGGGHHGNGRTHPDVCVPLEMGYGGCGCYLAKQDLRTEKVWSFISQQIQIRILIQPLNLVYPFNPRLGGVYMYVSERQIKGGGAADSARNRLKIQLYMSFCLLNMMNDLIT